MNALQFSLLGNLVIDPFKFRKPRYFDFYTRRVDITLDIRYFKYLSSHPQLRQFKTNTSFTVQHFTNDLFAEFNKNDGRTLNRTI